MSLTRLIYYGALVGGWAAFLGWLAAEQLVQLTGGSASGRLSVLVFAALVGACIGAGLNLLAGMANAQFVSQLKRLGPGLLCGAIGGAVGALLGDLLYVAGLPRALGWTIMGAGIGIVEGLYEGSASKLRNGLIGGATGGLIGGVLFDVIQLVIRSQSGLSSRATAFVVLGMCIGVMIAVVQVILKQAWLTVVDGYRPRRELILSQAITVLGRSESLPLPFFGAPSKHVEPEHARITRQKDSTYLLEDNHTKIGTVLNKKVIDGPVPLNDGDVIRLGNNVIRFHQKRRDASHYATVAPTSRSKRAPLEIEIEPEPWPASPTAAAASPASPPPTAPVAASAGRVPPPRPAPPPPPTPTTQRPAAPSPPPPRPAAPPGPPPAPAPARPAAPTPPASRPIPAAAPAPPISPAPATDECPGCGRKVPGPIGKRYCPVCHRRF